MNDERLVAVGTGIRAVGQMTVESIAWIKRADKVLWGLNDPIAQEMIRTLNPAGEESLLGYFVEGKERRECYLEIAERAITLLREDKVVCMVAYGHPGVFVDATHEAIRRARAAGFKARMLPAVSAEDCLYADLGVDPASGCQIYEATDFLINNRMLDPTCHFVLWQIGVLGNINYSKGGYQLRGLPQLMQKLLQYYPPNHIVYMYEAPSSLPGVEPTIIPVPLIAFPSAIPSQLVTMYIPPAYPPRTDTAMWQLMTRST